MLIRFTIPGMPGTKGRPQASTIWRTGPDGRKHLVTRRGQDGREHPILNVRTPKDTANWEATVRDFGSRAMRDAERWGQPMVGPIAIRITAVYPRPGSITRKSRPNPECAKGTKPDYDNIAKAITDALNGIVYADDGQISDAIVHKRYAAGPSEASRGACVEVEILELESPDAAVGREFMHGGLFDVLGEV